MVAETVRMSESALKVARCPPPLEPVFAEAERRMATIFGDFERSPERAEILVSGERYVLMRSASFSTELHAELRKAFGDAGARQIRYRIARALGIQDAKMLHERLGVKDPFLRMALGPAYFAHLGWSTVDIFEESQPALDETCFLAYSHPVSFEATDHAAAKTVASQPVCVMNAGYSSGWGQASFGVELQGEEVSCRGCGHERCVFVMAHPSRLADHVRTWREKLGLV
jgi:uncharacterized protein